MCLKDFDFWPNWVCWDQKNFIHFMHQKSTESSPPQGCESNRTIVPLSIKFEMKFYRRSISNNPLEDDSNIIMQVFCLWFCWLFINHQNVTWEYQGQITLLWCIQPLHYDVCQSDIRRQSSKYNFCSISNFCLTFSI